MNGFRTDEIIGKHFEWLVQRYQVGVEDSMMGSDFVLHGVDGLFYKCQRWTSNVVSPT